MIERRCPDCGVLLEAGHARCRPCFLRFDAAYRRKTERDWMMRNYPELRPRELFPEDGWDEMAMREVD